MKTPEYLSRKYHIILNHIHQALHEAREFDLFLRAFEDKRKVESIIEHLTDIHKEIDIVQMYFFHNKAEELHEPLLLQDIFCYLLITIDPYSSRTLTCN